MLTTIHEGGCLCGAIRYRAAGAPTASSLCHCRTCRRASGAPSVAWTIFRAADFAITSGEPQRFRSSPDVTRTFCGNCGTPLTYHRDEDTQTMDVTTATLDQPDAFAPACEIWIEHKLPWEPVDPTRPHYPRSSKGAS